LSSNILFLAGLFNAKYAARDIQDKTQPDAARKRYFSGMAV